jgi:putative aldouronate transport system substrate-binding protein
MTKKNHAPLGAGLALLCLGALFSGCAKKEAASGSPVPGEEAALSYPIAGPGENRRLSFWLPIQPPAAKHISSYNEHQIFQIINKNTGVEVEFIHPAVGQEREQLGILIASGDLPEIIQIRGLYNGGSGAGVAEGLFRDLSDLIPRWAPDYYREITKTETNYRRATGNDGKLSAILEMKQVGPPFFRPNYRQDVMDRLGLDIPVTIADYEEDFAKMKAAGLTGFAPPADGKIDLLMFPYGIAPGFYIGADGIVKWGEMESGYKQYLEMMHRWYAASYISRDFMSNMTVVERRALFTSNRVSLIFESVDLIKSAAEAVKARSVPLPYPRLTPGQQIPFDTVGYETRPNPGAMDTVIAAAGKNPEIALQYLNYFFTPEGADLANWGVKGEAYLVESNGNKRFTDHMLRNPKIPLADVQTLLKIHLFAKLAEPDVVCNPNVVIDAEALEYRLRYSDDPGIDDSRRLPPFQLSLEDSQARSAIMRDINTYMGEMTLKFITGAAPLGEFDNYVAQIKKMNIGEALRITEKGYQEYLHKPGLPVK